MEQVLVRNATLQDCKGIQHVHRNDIDPWHFIDECIAWIGKRLERGFVIQVAEVDGIIVGHSEWIMTHDPCNKFLYLGMLQIDDDFQRRGIGRKMIEEGFRIATEQGCNKLVTNPETDNTSKEFYQKCGFMEGRKIKSTALPTNDSGYSRHYTVSENAPFSVIRERPFVFGAGQASPRHMWEINNQKPSTDDRMVATLISDDGSCMQLGWFEGNETAYVLCWNDAPDHHCVNDILSFGHHSGFKSISFEFFDEYEALFTQFDAKITIENVELVKLINHWLK